MVEVSSFQLEATDSFRPRVAVLLNVTPDHLDRHLSFEAYRQAKERIFANQEQEDWAVVYGGNPLTKDMGSRSRSQKIYYSLDCIGDKVPHVCVKQGWIVRHEDAFTSEWIPLESIPIPGEHNVENVMAAAAAAGALGVPAEAMRDAVASFPGIPHALERVTEIAGVSFYDDSKATNGGGGASRHSELRRGCDFGIWGGRSKGADFKTLLDDVRGKVKLVLALGEAREQIAGVLGSEVPVVLCTSLREVVGRAFEHSEPGDTVLFSPACASFDMFADYAERGRLFKEEVERLKKKKRPEGGNK